MSEWVIKIETAHFKPRTDGGKPVLTFVAAINRLLVHVHDGVKSELSSYMTVLLTTRLKLTCRYDQMMMMMIMMMTRYTVAKCCYQLIAEY